MRMQSIPRPVAAVRLDGGRPCLDFINTIHDRDAAQPEDYICTPARFVAWSVRAGLLAPNEARNIRMPADRSRLMREIMRFRTSLHLLLKALINRVPITPSMTRELDEWLQRAWRDLAVDPLAKDSLRWRKRARDARLPLKRIALSALELLREGNLARLKCCSNPAVAAGFSTTKRVTTTAAGVQWKPAARSPRSAGFGHGMRATVDMASDRYS